MKKLVTMRAALASPDLFAPLIGGDSWSAWRVLLISLMGEPLTPEERTVFHYLTGRENEPGEQVEEFWGIIGRRGGKTRAISILASYIAALVDYRAVLAPGERGVLPVMAASTDQAGSAFNFICGVFDKVPRLGALITARTADTLTLKTGVDIRVKPASFRTIRSITAIGVIADEIAFWHNENSVNPDKDILDAVRPALATTGGPLIAISSPHARKGELYRVFRKHHGPEGDRLILVAKAPSKTMHPTLRQGVIDRAYEHDAAAASAEYGAEFRNDLEVFVSREVVDAVTIPDRFELPKGDHSYIGFVDPSGGGADSYTMAIAHKSGDTAVLDVVRERRPPFSPEAVTEEFADLFKAYGVTKIKGDNYAGDWPKEAFRKNDVDYDLSDRFRSAIYQDLLPMLNSRRVELLDLPKLTTQLCSLERRTARSGRDSINHAPGAHDDVINAAAGALVECMGTGGYDSTMAWVGNASDLRWGMQ